jgi:acetyl-CoA C-acetyltransferase
MAKAQQANKFADEIVPMKTKMKVVDKETKEEHRRLHGRPRRVQPARHHARRPRQARAGAGEGKYITAGNASQLSDGAAAVVLMEAKEAERAA